MRSLAVWLLSAGAVLAEPLDTQQAFDSYTQGKTLYFQRGDGRDVFAAETYLPGNRVQWFTRDGTCVEGKWYVEARQICFVYENNPTPQCWDTQLEPTGLMATPTNPPGGFRFFETAPPATPFQCLGPKVGV